MKSYVALALAGLVILILALSTLTVAVALLMKETYQGAVAVSEVVVEVTIELSEWWSYIRYAGAF